MSGEWLAVITGVLGVAGTLTAWFFNPERRYLRELDQVNQKLAVLYETRDRALDENDTDSLTRLIADIVKLQSRRNEILQRLGQGGGR